MFPLLLSFCHFYSFHFTSALSYAHIGSFLVGIEMLPELLNIEPPLLHKLLAGVLSDNQIREGMYCVFHWGGRR